MSMKMNDILLVKQFFDETKAEAFVVGINCRCCNWRRHSRVPFYERTFSVFSVYPWLSVRFSVPDKFSSFPLISPERESEKRFNIRSSTTKGQQQKPNNKSSTTKVQQQTFNKIHNNNPQQQQQQHNDNDE